MRFFPLDDGRLINLESTCMIARGLDGRLEVHFTCPGHIFIDQSDHARLLTALSQCGAILEPVEPAQTGKFYIGDERRYRLRKDIDALIKTKGFIITEDIDRILEKEYGPCSPTSSSPSPPGSPSASCSTVERDSEPPPGFGLRGPRDV